MILTSGKPFKMKIETVKDVKVAREVIWKIAHKRGFDKFECSQLAMAVSEIAGNAVKFAKDSSFTAKLSRNKKGLEITVTDKGQGIKNIKRAMKEGISIIQGSMGIGLNAAKRAVDEFIINSRPGLTKVCMKKFLPIAGDKVEYGIISLADDCYNVNGDSYLAEELNGDTLLFAIIDGTGQGKFANLAANCVRETIEENRNDGLISIIKKCHASLKKSRKKSRSRGVAIGLMRIKPNIVEYIGIGSVTAYILTSRGQKNLASQGGILGTEYIPEQFTLIKYRFSGDIMVFMHSDGIKDDFSVEDLPLNKRSQAIADLIMKNHHYNYGDATVMVVKRKK